MKNKFLIGLTAGGMILVCTTASMAGLINYDRLNKKQKAAPALVKMQGIVTNINYGSSEITVRNNKTSDEHKFVVNSDILADLSKGKTVEIAFNQGSNSARSVDLLKE